MKDAKTELISDKSIFVLIIDYYYLCNKRPPQPRRWLTAEEVCKALRITKRALQYYRSEGIIPSTSLGNKILYKESDIARILQNNLIAPSK